jgi:hypothetical protein
MNDIGSLLGLISVIGVAITIRIFAGRFDRRRIREYVESGGGTVLDIVWNPFGPGWSGSRERIYDVKYKTRHGHTRVSTCKTSMSAGVYWTGPEPPSGLTHDRGANAMAAILDASNTPPEPITCLSCGTRIPASQTQCPKCGWSYKGA